MERIKVGDLIRQKPNPPPVAEVIEVSDSSLKIRWPSGLEMTITETDKYEICQD